MLLLPDGLLARASFLDTADGGTAYCCQAWQPGSVPPPQPGAGSRGGAMGQPQLGTSGTFLGTWGMAVGNWRPALLQRRWGSGWWPQGIMKRGPGPWAGWGEPWGGAGRALRAALAFWCQRSPAQELCRQQHVQATGLRTNAPACSVPKPPRVPSPSHKPEA